jgi:hypothetical protein
MSGDLYPISVNPGPGGDNTIPGYYTVPQPVAAAAGGQSTIGGSDVGVNTQDDTRVLDLIKQYLNTSSVLNELNYRLIVNNRNIVAGIGAKVVDGWYSPNSIALQSTDEGTHTGLEHHVDHTITIPAGNFPLLVDFSARLHLTYVANVITTSDVQMECDLYVDGVILPDFTQFYLTQNRTMGQTYALDTVLSLHTAIPAGLSEGKHTFSIHYLWAQIHKNDNSVSFTRSEERLIVSQTALALLQEGEPA